MIHLIVFILVLTLIMKKAPKVSHVFQIKNWAVAFLFSFIIAFVYYILFQEIQFGIWATTQASEALLSIMPPKAASHAIRGVGHFLILVTNVIVIEIFHQKVKGFQIIRWYWRFILALLITGSFIMIAKYGM